MSLLTTTITTTVKTINPELADALSQGKHAMVIIDGPDRNEKTHVYELRSQHQLTKAPDVSLWMLEHTIDDGGADTPLPVTVECPNFMIEELVTTIESILEQAPKNKFTRAGIMDAHRLMPTAAADGMSVKQLHRLLTWHRPTPYNGEYIQQIDSVLPTLDKVLTISDVVKEFGENTMLVSHAVTISLI